MLVCQFLINIVCFLSQNPDCMYQSEHFHQTTTEGHIFFNDQNYILQVRKHIFSQHIAYGFFYGSIFTCFKL